MMMSPSSNLADNQAGMEDAVNHLRNLSELVHNDFATDDNKSTSNAACNVWQ